MLRKMPKKDVGNLLLCDLNLSVRTFNCLYRAGIETLPQVADLTLEELQKIRNFGSKSVEEIMAKLEEYGLHLKDSAVLDTISETNSHNEQEQVSEEDVTVDSDKQDLVTRILQQQQIIHRQQAEIARLKALAKESK